MEQLIDDRLAGKTIAAIVRVLRPEVPWSKARKWCQAGRVTVDGEVVRDAAARVAHGARVVLGAPQRDASKDIEFVALDRHFVVVDKPAGLVTVPYVTRGDPRGKAGDEDTLRGRVHMQLRRRTGSTPPPRVVQRLDRDTSGVMIFARTSQAERALQQQLRTHDVDREYVALCWGRAASVKHDTHLIADRGDRRRGSSRRPGRPEQGAKRAITDVRVLEYFPDHDITLVACRLHTGRQHQIRIHLGEAGNPLLGERVYTGPLELDRAAWSKDHDPKHADLGVTRTMLHARRLGIEHPTSGEAQLFTSDPPPDFAGVLSRLRRA